MAAYGLYTHIASNKFRSMVLLAGLFVLFYVVVYAGALIAEVMLDSDQTVNFYLTAAARDLGMAFPYATGAAALWIVIAYFFHQSIIDAVTGGEDVTRQQQPRLYNLLENLCISRGIPMPKLKVMESDALNAFATGLNQRQYAITVTSGLLRALNDQEIEAVLGHELTHIRNGDVQMMVIAVIIAVVLIALAWLLSQLVKLALSRSRELLADAGSVELTKNPDAMISALRKIENRGELPGATSAVMELCVDNPREGFADLFATHPSVDSRVQALVKFAGGHDPGRLALPSDMADQPDDPEQPAGGQTPPPLPHGPWSDARDPGGVSRGVPQEGTSQGPWLDPAGPWGRH